MSKRYFKNVLLDGQEVDSNTFHDFWKDNVYRLMECISQNTSLSPDNDLYTGTTGIAYMFFHLSTSEGFKNDSAALLNKAVAVSRLMEHNLTEKCSSQFICGDAGVNAVNAAIYHQIGDEKTAEMYLERFKNGLAVCKPINFFKPGGDELFVGRAGYLYGILWLEKVFSKKIIADLDIIQLCLTIVESGRNYSKKNKSIFPLMYSYYNTEYLGAAHGLCTILQVLISFPCFIEKDQKIMEDIKRSIDILISFQTTSGNFPCAMDELNSRKRPEKDELVHWCHGAPGVIYLLAKAYLVFKEPTYLECCLKCGDLVWTKGLLKKGPGLCHGIAGNGYVFLLLYRLTGDKKHLNRAIEFGKFIFTDECIQGSRRPDNLYSLYEGLAGTVCYLSDLMQPEKASFPFLDVF
ncbi:PREDICTED: lanC-like protein 3 homolog [Diuraphis noxia]|uniref:lanC-like protein 3 homolog n=1 Tax=Diuraphis noxia TaxID=143948 RepID=UPI0007635AAC|nr:PREDICTED: lanC-like protein 3 homolog [Diuraphis noxia]